MLAIMLFGLARRVKVYEVFIASAKEGFQIAIVIIPFLVAILVGIAMFRASGAMDALVGVLSPVTSRLGFPAEALPMALIKPLSGSGALGVMSETMKTHGPDSFIGYLVCLLNAGTETTFYVLAVYFGERAGPGPAAHAGGLPDGGPRRLRRGDDPLPSLLRRGAALAAA